jgi:hypothetical protein
MNHLGIKSGEKSAANHPSCCITYLMLSSLCLMKHEVVSGSGSIAPQLFILALDGDELSASRTFCFTPGDTTPSTHCIGGWVGPRSGLDATEKRKFFEEYLIPEDDTLHNHCCENLKSYTENCLPLQMLIVVIRPVA